MAAAHCDVGDSVQPEKQSVPQTMESRPECGCIVFTNLGILILHD